MRVVLLGPQRRPTLAPVARALGGEGPFATVAAGWQEREDDDAELREVLGGRVLPLRLHARWQDVLEKDREYAAAERDHAATLRELQALYLLQLDAALRAYYATAERTEAQRSVREVALADALELVQVADARHERRVREAQERFVAAWRPAERDVVAWHRGEVRGLLDGAAALVVTGGHVGVLLDVLRLFSVRNSVPAAVVAWSAGAMALTERVVTFSDRAPQGPSHAEVHDVGLGLVPGAVLLPHARRRLLVDDSARMAALAARFAPARCVVLDDGVRLDLGPDGALPAAARVVRTDGRIGPLDEGAGGTE